MSRPEAGLVKRGSTFFPAGSRMGQLVAGRAFKYHYMDKIQKEACRRMGCNETAIGTKNSPRHGELLVNNNNGPAIVVKHT